MDMCVPLLFCGWQCFNEILVGAAVNRRLKSGFFHIKTVLLKASALWLHLNHHQDSTELPWQEWKPLHLTDPGPIHIPGIQERAERLISRFKGKPDRPPKVNTMHGYFVQWGYFV